MKILLLSLLIVITVVVISCKKQTDSPALIFYDREDRKYFTHPLLDSIYYASTNTNMYRIGVASTGITRELEESRHRIEAFRLFKRFLKGHGKCGIRLLKGRIEVIPNSDMNTGRYDTTLRIVFIPNMGYW